MSLPDAAAPAPGVDPNQPFDSAGQTTGETAGDAQGQPLDPAGEADDLAQGGPAEPPRPTMSRARAVAEVVLCSGYPTQLLLGGLLIVAGLRPQSLSGELSAPFVFLVSLGDAALLTAIIWRLLVVEGVRPRDVLLGSRHVGRETLLGLAMGPFVLLLVGAVMLGLRTLAPWLRNVPTNPLTTLLDTPAGLIATLVVAIVAGGIREEVQRAFLLKRFRDHLGGPGTGLVVTSVAFGVGHTMQGWDAAIAAGLLGLLWGAMTLARGGAVASMACHATFNSLQLLIAGTMSPSA